MIQLIKRYWQLLVALGLSWTAFVLGRRRPTSVPNEHQAQARIAEVHAQEIRKDVEQINNAIEKTEAGAALSGDADAVAAELTRRGL